MANQLRRMVAAVGGKVLGLVGRSAMSTVRIGEVSHPGKHRPLTEKALADLGAGR